MTSDERVLVGIDSAGKPVSIVGRPAAHAAQARRLQLRGAGADRRCRDGARVRFRPGPASRRDPLGRLLAGDEDTGFPRDAARGRRVAPVAAPLVGRARGRRARRARREHVGRAGSRARRQAVSAKEGAVALDETRRRLQLGRSAPDLYARVPRAPLSQSEPIVAPLDVRVELEGKTYSLPPRRRRADALHAARSAGAAQAQAAADRDAGAAGTAAHPAARVRDVGEGCPSWARACVHAARAHLAGPARDGTRAAVPDVPRQPDTDRRDACRLRLRDRDEDRGAAAGGIDQSKRPATRLADRPLRTRSPCSPRRGPRVVRAGPNSSIPARCGREDSNL